jgi:hypothetical protein
MDFESLYPLPVSRERLNAAKTLSASLLSVTAALFLSACGGGDYSDAVACTLEARASVVIRTVDTGGLPIVGTTVSYQINDGALQTVSCPAAGTCSIGSEQSGRFRLTVNKAGYVSQSTEVKVNADECHVLTEQVTVVLRRTT